MATRRPKWLPENRSLVSPSEPEAGFKSESTSSSIFKYLMSSTSSTNLAWIVSSGRKSCAHDPNSPTRWMSLCRGTSFTTSQTSGTACLGRTWSSWWSPQKSRFRINLNFGHLIINIGETMSNTLAPEYQAPKHELPCRCNFVWPNFSDSERFESVKMSQRKSQLMNQIRQATSSEATPPLEDTSHSHDRC